MRWHHLEWRSPVAVMVMQVIVVVTSHEDFHHSHCVLQTRASLSVVKTAPLLLVS